MAGLKDGHLTPRERIFLRKYLGGSSLTDAYLEICPDVRNPSLLGSRMLKRIKKKRIGKSCLMREISAMTGSLKRSTNGLTRWKRSFSQRPGRRLTLRTMVPGCALLSYSPIFAANSRPASTSSIRGELWW